MKKKGKEKKCKKKSVERKEGKNEERMEMSGGRNKGLTEIQKKR